MQFHLSDFLKDIVSCTSSIITIFFTTATNPSEIPPFEKQKPENANPPKAPKKKKPTNRFSSIRHSPQHRTRFLIGMFAISGAVIFLINLLGDIVIPVAPATPSPSKTPFPMITPPILISIGDAWLDEIKPLLPRNKSVFINEWNHFDPIQVKGVKFPHSIGLCIPEAEQHSYFESASSTEEEHTEDIEYLLSYSYQSLQFDYGIDDLSFPDNLETACMCEYKIIVQACNSTEYFENDSDVLFESDWINYRSSIHRTPIINVSDCEAIRITVKWKFNIRTDGPIAFNIAIINPFLRGKKIGTTVEEPRDIITKPDSIR